MATQSKAYVPVLLLCLLLPVTYATAAETSLPVTPATQIIQLFNGRDSTGWYTWLVDTRTEDPRQVFTVTNGTVHISGDGLGYLGTKARYRDYALVVEFRWGKVNTKWNDRIGAARDSGVFLHATGPDGNSHDGNGAFKAAIECNVFQGATGDFLLIRGSAVDGSLIAPRIRTRVAARRDADGWPFWAADGQEMRIEKWGRVNWSGKDRNWKDVQDFRGTNDLERSYGEWNRLECVCEGDRITVRLNGTVVNRAWSVWPNEGQILLQCEGSEIFYRKLELHPLAKRSLSG